MLTKVQFKRTIQNIKTSNCNEQENLMGNQVFAERVKQERAKKNLTMDQLAQKLEVTKSRVNMWENNGTVPRQDVLIKLTQLFGVSADYLLGNEKMQGKEPVRPTLNRIQRGLKRLDDKDLDKAEGMLSAVFEGIFNGK